MKRTRIKRHTAMPTPTRWGIAHRRPRRLTPRDPELVAAYEAMNELGGDFAVKTRPTADPAFIEWLHTQPCLFARELPGHVCHGSRIVAAHEGPGGGMALKCPDRQAFPACDGGHTDFTISAGEFKTWTKERRREFENRVVESEYARYLSSGSRRAA